MTDSRFIIITRQQLLEGYKIVEYSQDGARTITRGEYNVLENYRDETYLVSNPIVVIGEEENETFYKQ